MHQDDRTFRNRGIHLILVILLWCVLIVAQLVKLQVVQGEEIKQQAENMHSSRKAIPALRGQVLDANGRTLAISLWESSITADPSAIEDPEETVNALAKAMGKGERWKATMLSRLSNKKAKFRYIQKRASAAETAAVRDLNLRGIHFGREAWRKYPNQWLGSHVLGFANQDLSATEGIERAYNQKMQGQKGLMETMRDGKGRRNSVAAKIVKDPRDGSDLHLTLDVNIQLFVEDALRRGYRSTQAESITAIVMDPRNGAILAMANLPDFNPNAFGQASVGARRNRAIVDVYEPGSAFKVITAAAALDSGAVKANQSFYSPEGSIVAIDKRIRNHPPYGSLTLDEVLWHSSNAGIVKVALEMDTRVFHDYIERFGFGNKTGIDLPAESPGILRPHAEWERVSPYFLSMGHEISTTPLQMITALCAVANGGYLVEPFVVSHVVDPDGVTEDLRPSTPPKKIIKSSTAKRVAQALEGVVTKGTAKTAAIDGVRVFGKTGTAQRIQGRTYAKNKYNSSFVGFFPAEAPRYGMIVVVHDPKGTKVHGGDVAAPIFSEIGQRIMDYERASAPSRQITVTERVPRWSDESVTFPENLSQMPDFTGFGLRNLLMQARRLGLKVEIKGSGRVHNQWPRPGEPIPMNRNCTVTLNEG